MFHNHPGHEMLRTLIPDTSARRAWVVNACHALSRAETVTEGRALVGYMADSFIGLDPIDRKSIIDFIADI